MRDEQLDLQTTKPTVPYKLKITIVVQGRAPADNGEFPFLPISFFEYIQTLSQTYEEKFQDDGFFVLVSLVKKEEMPNSG